MCSTRFLHPKPAKPHYGIVTQLIGMMKRAKSFTKNWWFNMKSFEVKKVSEKEYHVIEKQQGYESEFILARCSGPVPAWDIVLAMRLSQTLKINAHGLENYIFGIKQALETFNHEIKNITSSHKELEV